jgi:hypothetical protein
VPRWWLGWFHAVPDRRRQRVLKLSHTAADQMGALSLERSGRGEGGGWSASIGRTRRAVVAGTAARTDRAARASITTSMSPGVSSGDETIWLPRRDAPKPTLDRDKAPVQFHHVPDVGKRHGATAGTVRLAGVVETAQQVHGRHGSDSTRPWPPFRRLSPIPRPRHQRREPRSQLVPPAGAPQAPRLVRHCPGESKCRCCPLCGMSGRPRSGMVGQGPTAAWSDARCGAHDSSGMSAPVSAS